MKKGKLKIKAEGLLPYWKAMKKARIKFNKEINKVENKMQKAFKEPCLSFFWIDGEIVGIGTYPYSDKMDLIHDTELEKENE